MYLHYSWLVNMYGLRGVLELLADCQWEVWPLYYLSSDQTFKHRDIDYGFILRYKYKALTIYTAASKALQIRCKWVQPFQEEYWSYIRSARGEGSVIFRVEVNGSYSEAEHLNLPPHCRSHTQTRATEGK